MKPSKVSANNRSMQKLYKRVGALVRKPKFEQYSELLKSNNDNINNHLNRAIDEYIEHSDTSAETNRAAWLDEFHKAVQESMDEEMPDFPRAHFGRELVDLSD